MQLLKPLFFLLLPALFFSVQLPAQEGYYFRHYQVEQGLSHNSVLCSLQDKLGFMWLGTKDGLNRFDGNSFKVFKHEEGKPSSIGNDYIRYLHQTPDGEMYVGTQRGLYQYNPQTESFRHLSHSGSRSIKEITTDRQGQLWYIAEGTLVCLNRATGQTQIFDKASYFWATSMCTDSKGNFWVSTADGQLKMYSPAQNSFATYSLFKEPVATGWVEKIYAESNGNLLAGTSAHGLFSFNSSTGKATSILSQNPDKTGIFVRDILLYKKNEYWLATESGVFIYQSGRGTVTNLKKDYRNPYALSDNAVYTLCKDKEGGLWAGTFFGGVNYYVEQHAVFQKYFPEFTKAVVRGNAVREITKDRYGNLWIGTEDAGLNKIDPSGNSTHLMPNGSKNALSYYNIHGLLAVDNELWVSTFEHGLDVLNIKTDKVVRHYEAGNSSRALKSNFIFSMHRTRAGRLLLATTAGVFAYHKNSDSFSAVPALNGYTYAVLEDSKGIWWSATISEGIKYYNPQTGQSGNYQHQAGNPNSLSNNMVNALFEDSRGALWVATEGGGLCRMSANRKEIRRYTLADGLPSTFVFKVLEDNEGQLWITTSKGLAHLNPQTQAITVYTSANGLLNDQFNYNSGYKDENGRLFFGSVKGMVSFNPKSLRQNSFVPPVYFTGFQVNNSELAVGAQSPLKQSVLYSNSIQLPHHQSSFSIDFAALSYTAPQMNVYAYKMEGVDSRWTTLEKNRKVYFTNLAPGAYVFKVKGANGSGIWNQQEATLHITVRPPWWQSPTAYVLYALFSLLLAFLAVRYYHRLMKQKAQQRMNLLHFEKEKELYEAKMKFFTNIAHEIKTPLTLIKGPLERVIQKAEGIPGIKTSLAIMERNTDRLVELTNQLLDYRQAEAGGFILSFKEENISQLLQEAYLSFQPLAEEKQLSYTLHLAQTPLVAYADSEALNKIISNLLGNAIKYADKIVALKLLVNRKEKTFTLSFQNDGCSIPTDMQEKIFEPFVRLKTTEKQAGTGIGLALARSLTQLHGGTLRLTSNIPLTVFTLTLPIHDERTAPGEIHSAADTTTVQNHTEPIV